MRQTALRVVVVVLGFVAAVGSAALATDYTWTGDGQDEFWDDGDTNYWNDGDTNYWNDGDTNYWNDGDTNYWNDGDCWTPGEGWPQCCSDPAIVGDVHDENLSQNSATRVNTTEVQRPFIEKTQSSRNGRKP